MRLSKGLTPTVEDVGREVIFIPDLKRGYLIEVKPPLARFQVFGSTHISITNLDNLQLSFQAAVGHFNWGIQYIGRNN